jgi:hypothetical protein
MSFLLCFHMLRVCARWCCSVFHVLCLAVLFLLLFSISSSAVFSKFQNIDLQLVVRGKQVGSAVIARECMFIPCPL